MSTQNSSHDLPYWLAFNQILSIGPVRHKRLRQHFTDLKQAWQAAAKDLHQAGIESSVITEIIDRRKTIDPIKLQEALEKHGVKTVTINDAAYPALLKEIYAPPPLLYYRGRLPTAHDFLFAVVGSRKVGSYGRQVTTDVVSGLARAGLTIVSGLAFGVDACAHQSTIAARGKTVAVLGSGLAQVYPAANQALAQRIVASGGLLISEFPLDMPALRHHFPQRNRIISGVSLGVLITEAREKSGALITAACALEQNREVFAVPGSIYHPGSAGPNKLITSGAHVVTQPFDVLEILNLKNAPTYKQNQELIPESGLEASILAMLSSEPLHVDKIAQTLRLNISAVNGTLALMEMKGMVKHLGGQYYAKAR